MRIIMSGGGTLGSVTPLLAAAQAIKRIEPTAELLWVGTRGGPEEKLVAAAGIPFRAISSGKLRRYFDWRNFVDLARIICGFFESRRLLKGYRPDAVVMAGGYVAVPVVWAAATLKIPVYVHQMDIRPGLANRLAAPFAKGFSVAFEKSLRDFAKKNPVWTGNPIRQLMRGGSRDEARKLFGLEEGIPTVLVIGGGTGAINLNRLVRRAAPAICERAQVIHLTGAGKAEGHEGMPTRYHEMEFLADDLRHALAAAYLVVTRAGMGTLTELAALGLPTVIVPIPDSHQEENAKLFADAGAAVMVNEKTTFSKALADQILALLSDGNRLSDLRQKMLKMNRPDADEALAREILKTAAS
jgi:UDP-N-acetylglucosamine--N-acetylmuramyl-(pentapeptide) pyrophosphoryl-undecaprenol N-acetylglucosamine transferase